MLPITSSKSKKELPSLLVRFLNFSEKNLIHLIIILSLFSYYITAVILTIIKIIFGKKKTELNFYTKPILIYFLLNALFVLVSFEIETSVNYLVTYFDENKYNYEPLKDNFQQIMTLLFPWWNSMIEQITQYITLPGADSFSTTIILIIIIGMLGKFKTKDANILIHAGIYLKIMAITRIIRVIAFSIVLMPNPRLNCYLDKFRVPENTTQMILDMIKFRNAGCNDLVISGHTLFIWVTFKIICKLIGKFTSVFLKIVVPIVLFNIIMIKNHYSVDVFLGILVAEYIWEKVMNKEKNLIEFYSKDNKTIQDDYDKSDEKLSKFETDPDVNGKVLNI